MAVSNTLLTIDMITREALRLFRNTNKFLRLVKKTYDPQFAQTGWKIGDNLRIRLPNSFTPGLGAAVTIQGTNEKYVNIPLATQRNVTVGYSSSDKALKLDDFGRIILAPQMNGLGGAVATDLMSVSLSGCNFASTVDGSSNITTPNNTTINRLQALLTLRDTPVAGRMFICNPISLGKIAAGLGGLFNNPTKISKIYDDGSLDGSIALGGTWWNDQLVQTSTTGAYVGNVHVGAASQTGTALLVNALPGPLNKGDFINIANVYAVNPVAFSNNGQLQQFVVTADAAQGATTLNIYPSIVPPSGGNVAQYQTVTTSPALNANITVLAKSGEQYIRNFLLHPEAVEMVSADLELPGNGVVKGSRQQWDGMSIRYLESYLFEQDVFASRIDYLYGYACVRPEFMGVLADSL